MKLTVLGAGTCLPVRDHSPSGHLVELGDMPILMDAGPGTIARLAARGVRYQDLQYVLVTHLHPDHTLDLLTLLQASNATPGWTRSRPLTLVGCQGLEVFLEQLFRTFDGVAPETFRLEVREMGAEQVAFPGWTLDAEFTGHTDASLAFRLAAEEKALVYSGDAAEIEGLARLSQGADLLLCECSLPEGWTTGDHLTPEQVGTLAREAEVGRVVLTHLYPPALDADVVAQVRRNYSGPVAVACDGWSAWI